MNFGLRIIIFAFLLACSSSGYKNNRPFEKFEPPEFSFASVIERGKARLDRLQKLSPESQPTAKAQLKKDLQLEYQNKVSSLDRRWRKNAKTKRIKFESFHQRRIGKFNKEQKQTRDTFIADKPSHEMLRSFLAEQASNQRNYHRGHQDDALFFNENEQRLEKEFTEFKKEQKRIFESQLNEIF